MEYGSTFPIAAAITGLLLLIAAFRPRLAIRLAIVYGIVVAIIVIDNHVLPGPRLLQGAGVEKAARVGGEP